MRAGRKIVIRLEGSRALVTGGAGFVGSHIVDQLVAQGVGEVIVLDNFVRGREENLSSASGSGRVKIVRGDIRDRRLVERAMRGVEYVFHQAGLRVTRCAEHPRECFEVLVDGTFNVVESCVAAGVKKIVAASSASVYGMAELFPTPEDHHPYNNRTLYGAGKVSNEQILGAFQEMYGLECVALRYFNVFGPRMDIHGAYTEVIIRWLDCIDRGEPPAIFGDGTQTMDFVYVEDVAVANIQAARCPAAGRVYNIGSGRETSLRELLEILLRITGSTLRADIRPERKVNPVARRLASTERAAKELGFVARVDLEEGLRRLVAWRKEVASSAEAVGRLPGG